MEYLLIIWHYFIGIIPSICSLLSALKNPYIISFYINRVTRKPYQDNLCFFTCLHYHFKDKQSYTVLQYLNHWRIFNNCSEIPSNSIGNFKGVTIEEMNKLEQCFDVKIIIVPLNSSTSVNLLYDSFFESENVIYLNNYENHLSYIANYSKVANKFQCEKCNKMFNRHWHLKRHYANCYERMKYVFPGGFHKHQETIFDKLESLTIYVPDSDTYYPSFIVWDMEAVLMKTNASCTDQMNFLSKHISVSVSVSSNVEGFCEPKCFVDISSYNLISNMMTYLIEISSVNLSRLKLKYDYVFQDLDDLLTKYSADPESDPDLSDTSSTESTNEKSLSSNVKLIF